jgi:hypothetical protein
MWAFSPLMVIVVKINEQETSCKKVKTPTRVRFTPYSASRHPTQLPIHLTLMMQ